MGPGPATGRAGRRIALLNNEDAERWQGRIEKLWKDAVLLPGDSCSMYECWRGEFPSVEEATAYDVIILGGSHYSVYEDHPWIRQLKELLPRYVAAGVKIYGSCFGCQILAEALGGRVGPNPSGRFTLTYERVTPTEQLQQLPGLESAVQAALASIQAPGSNQLGGAPGTAHPEGTQVAAAGAAEAAAAVDELSQQLDQASCSTGAGFSPPEATGAGTSGAFHLMESHGDQVLELPPGALQLASSATAPNELWVLPPNVLASQFHPEFGGSLALETILPRLVDLGRLDSEEAAAAALVFTSGQHDFLAIQDVVQHFINHGVGPVRESHREQDARLAGGASGRAATAAAAPASGQELGTSSCSSPTAASERSSAAASTASVPFLKLAQQRRQQEREVGLHEECQKVLTDAGAAFDMRMEAASLEMVLLQQLNEAAAGEYSKVADVGTALAQFSRDMGKRQGAIQEALVALPELDRQLSSLEETVAGLDHASQQLEVRLGLTKPISGVGVYLGAALGKAGAGGCGGGGSGTMTKH